MSKDMYKVMKCPHCGKLVTVWYEYFVELEFDIDKAEKGDEEGDEQ